MPKTTDQKLKSATATIKSQKKRIKAAEHLLKVRANTIEKLTGDNNLLVKQFGAAEMFIAYLQSKLSTDGICKIPVDELNTFKGTYIVETGMEEDTIVIRTRKKEE